MTISEKQRLFAKYVGELLRWIYDNGYEVTFGEAYRHPYLQEMYVKQGKSKTMSSKHVIKLAVDLNLFKGGKYLQDTPSYKPLGQFWKSLDKNNVWGGDWGWDGNHFEYNG